MFSIYQLAVRSLCTAELQILSAPSTLKATNLFLFWYAVELRIFWLKKLIISFLLFSWAGKVKCFHLVMDRNCRPLNYTFAVIFFCVKIGPTYICLFHSTIFVWKSYNWTFASVWINWSIFCRQNLFEHTGSSQIISCFSQIDKPLRLDIFWFVHI